MSRISVSFVGLGYVGLSTAACFAHAGIPVRGIELDREKLASIEGGKAPFHERSLDRMIRSSVAEGTLQVGADYASAIEETSMTFLTVGTPSRPDGSIDLSYMESAAASVGREVAKKRSRHVVVVKSTVVPGTTEGLVLKALRESSGKECGDGFGLAANPEFLREGEAVKDTMSPEAVVIGSVDRASRDALLRLYRGFYSKMPPVISTTPANAELIKYAVNSFRATQLSFLNTFSNLCQGVPGADIDQVARGFSSITRADPRYLRAGLGFGGSCFPKDLRALIAHAKNNGSSPELLEATLGLNAKQPEVAVEMAKGLAGDLRGKKVAVLGLAFKAGTDDVRESVAIKLVERLIAEGAAVSVFDPAAMDNARRLLGDRVTYAGTARECLEHADCAVVATEWEEFGKIRPADMKRLMRTPVVLDGRRMLDGDGLDAAGLRWKAMGTGPRR